MREAISKLLELAPTTKLMYSSDAHQISEVYYLGAKWGLQILGEVLDQAIRDCDATAKEAMEIAHATLRENALCLYNRHLAL